MTDRPNDRFNDLLRRINDRDDAAIGELLLEAYPEIKKYTAAVLHKEFANRHFTTTGVTHEVWMRLSLALTKVKPTDARHFWRLVRQHVWFSAQDRLLQTKDGVSLGAYGPAPLARESDSSEHTWTFRLDGKIWVFTPGMKDVLLVALAGLREEEQAVLDCVIVLGYTQKEAAHALGMSVRNLQRIWVRAVLNLTNALYDAFPHLRSFLDDGLRTELDE